MVAAYPNARLKVILDNLNTHKKNDEWLSRPGGFNPGLTVQGANMRVTFWWSRVQKRKPSPNATREAAFCCASRESGKKRPLQPGGATVEV